MNSARILIVEDDRIIGRHIQISLESLGYEVVGAAVTGEEGVSLTESKQPDLVLMDICLPGALDGVEAASIIHERHQIPVIFLTAYSDPALLQRARASEPFGYIIKPFEEPALHAAIEMALQKDNLVRQQRESEASYRFLFEESPVCLWEEDMSEVKHWLDGLKESGIQDLDSYLQAHPEQIIENAQKIRVLNVNKAAIKFFKAEKKEQLLGEFLLPPDLQKFSTLFQGELNALFQGKVEYEGDVNIQDLQGNPLAGHVSLRVVPGYEQTYSKIIVSIQDITSRKERERELESIQQVYVALRSSPRRDDMPSILLEQFMQIWQASGVAYLIHKPGMKDYIVEYAAGVLAPFNQTSHPLESQGEKLCFFSGRPGCLNGIACDHLFRISLNSPDQCSLIYAPLEIHEPGTHVLVIQRECKFSGADLNLLTALSDLAANTLNRAALFEQTNLRLHRLNSLHAIDTAVNASLDLRVTLNFLLDQILLQQEPDAADILIYNPHTQRLQILVSHGFEYNSLNRHDIRLGEGLPGQVALERQIMIVANLQKNLRANAFEKEVSNMLDAGFVSYSAAPLVSKGQLHGVLELYHRKPIQEDAEWLNFLETLAGQAAIAIDHTSLYNNLQHTNLELTLAYDSTLEGWSRALDLRDRETEGHTQRVVSLVVQLARSMGVSEADLPSLRRGALLHDIGKMGIPDHILNKNGPLSEEEWKIMRKHPDYAYQMLLPITYLASALDIPYCHHEKWDGSGYPRGLKATQIPLSARIFAVIDVWDALLSKRSYRDAWTKQEALAYIRDAANVHFDPDVVSAFLNLINEHPELFDCS